MLLLTISCLAQDQYERECGESFRSFVNRKAQQKQSQEAARVNDCVVSNTEQKKNSHRPINRYSIDLIREENHSKIRRPKK